MFYTITVENEANRRAILPLLFKSLFGGLHSTSDTIQAMSANILNLYQELDSGLYKKLMMVINDSGKLSI